MPNAMYLNDVVNRFDYYPNEDHGGGGFDVAGLIERSIAGKVVVPDGTTKIGAYAFYTCVGITSVILPDSITEIQENAFYACINMTEINLPEGITTIGHRAFAACSKLKEIVAPVSCVSLVTSTLTSSFASFGGCDILERAKFPGVRVLSSYAAQNQYNMFSGVGMNSQNGFVIEFDSLETIPNQLFSGSGATKIILPSAVTIGESFQGSSKLAEVYIGPDCTTIGEAAFGGTKSGIVINCGFAEGAVTGAPWAATNATINYNVPVPNVED